MVPERITVIGDAGDLSAPPGSRPWAVATRLLIQGHLHTTTSNAQHLSAHLRGMREHEGWRQLTDARGAAFRTYEAFCVHPEPFGLGYDAPSLDQIIRERATAQQKALDATPLPAHGGPRRKQGRHTTLLSRDAGYQTARIARDRPDIHERMKAGEFRSVHQAAIAAGIRKVTVTVPLEPETIARVLRRRLSTEDRLALVALLAEEAP